MNNINKVQTSPVKLRAAERRIEALKHRLAGKTFAEIGEAMGVAAQTAHTYVKRAYELLLKEQNELAAEIRELTKNRLDAILAAHWEAAISGEDKAAADLVLRILDRITKLYGADAIPPERQLPEGGLSEEELRQQARMQGIDISDLEVLTDGEMLSRPEDQAGDPTGPTVDAETRPGDLV